VRRPLDPSRSASAGPRAAARPEQARGTILVVFRSAAANARSSRAYTAAVGGRRYPLHLPGSLALARPGCVTLISACSGEEITGFRLTLALLHRILTGT